MVIENTMHIGVKGYRILFFLLAIFIITSSIQIEGGSSSDPVMVLGPYPQNTNQNSTYIIWQTNIKTGNNSVHYGLDPTCKNIVYHDNETDFHKIRLKGLQPSSTYFYKVVSDELESNVHMFHTFLKKDEQLRFVVYGDTRGVWDHWRNASFLARVIKREQPFFALHTGDFVKNGKNISQWIDFFSISEYTHNCTIYPVLGNHEYYGDCYFKYFTLSKDSYWYSFDNGPIHFVGLDSNKKNRYNYNQLKWLIEDLRNNTQPFTIVFFHHPPYSAGGHGSTYILRLIWGPIFSLFDIDIVFNGHDHSYERGEVNGVTYVVTGGGGAPLYSVGKKWWTIYSEKTYHYCVINVDQQELFFEAKRLDEVVFDSFSIIKW